MSAPAKHHPTPLTFQRTLKFPGETGAREIGEASWCWPKTCYHCPEDGLQDALYTPCPCLHRGPEEARRGNGEEGVSSARPAGPRVPALQGPRGCLTMWVLCLLRDTLSSAASRLNLVPSDARKMNPRIKMADQHLNIFIDFHLPKLQFWKSEKIHYMIKEIYWKFSLSLRNRHHWIRAD